MYRTVVLVARRSVDFLQYFWMVEFGLFQVDCLVECHVECLVECHVECQVECLEACLEACLAECLVECLEGWEA